MYYFLSCHPDICPECVVHLKLDCHCQSIQMFIKCCDYYQADAAARDAMLTCKVRCPKTMLCGHLCPKSCHIGKCATQDVCTETKKVKCVCGRRRKEITCSEIRAGNAKVDCDERCAEIKEKKKKEKLETDEIEKAMEEKRQLDEVKKFERKKKGRKRKQRKTSETEEEVSVFQKYHLKWIISSALVVAVIALLVAHLMN